MGAEATWAGMFLVGLFGSTHCLGMCGGIVSALIFSVAPPLRRRPARLLLFLLAYNAGRIGSYMLAGALVGAFGAGLFGLVPGAGARVFSVVLAAGFMIALGLYLAGWWQGLQQLEQWGGVVWRRIEPLGRRLLPVTHPLKALAVGALWGWLPCGMVYAALAMALVSGSATAGAALMLAFGLGTLPMLLAVGSAAEWFRDFVRAPWVRRGAGLLVLGYGLYTMLATGRLLAPSHHWPGS